MPGTDGAPIAIRRATPDDIPLVASLFTRAHATLSFLPNLHTPAEDLAFWRDRLMVECEVWVAETGGRITGIMALDGTWLAQLQVDPDCHRQGVGSALIRHAQARQDRLQLWCFQANIAARALYERHGFTAVAFTEGEGNEEKTPDVRYEWPRATTNDDR